MSSYDNLCSGGTTSDLATCNKEYGDQIKMYNTLFYASLAISLIALIALCCWRRLCMRRGESTPTTVRKLGMFFYAFGLLKVCRWVVGCFSSVLKLGTPNTLSSLFLVFPDYSWACVDLFVCTP